MSLEIIKTGLLDTIQDTGRFGYQHLGINPGGAMDTYAAQASNALLGLDLSSPVLEFHFPAAEILFRTETIICLTGGDFNPLVNKKNIPLWQPVVIPKDSVLQFQKKISGARCYLSLLNEFKITKWLNSYNTNLAAATGGFKGRALKKGDILPFRKKRTNNIYGDDVSVLPWKATITSALKKDIRFIKGNEWDVLNEDAKRIFTSEKFMISTNSNRMGYRLQGKTLVALNETSLISSGVTFGTVQLLPDGQLIILMADHQTTGGYPRIAHVISADLPSLAQTNPAEEISFNEVELEQAQKEWVNMHRDLQQMHTASGFKIEKLYGKD